MSQGAVASQRTSLGGLAPAVASRLEAFAQARFGRRLWARDPTLWRAEAVPELADRLGWVDLPRAMGREVAALTAFGREAAGAGLHHLVLLGMGGSSLGPEVFQCTLGNAPGFPALTVLDSTHPASVERVAASVDLAATLFVVASKSGTTSETAAFECAFRHRLAAAGRPPGPQFVAITDPGSPLAGAAAERGYRRIFLAPADVGGRYSALAPFGLVPAALIGADLAVLAAGATAMAAACGPEVLPAANPGLLLGAALAEAARAGRDKLTLLTTAGLASLPDWIEQLVAESLGKDGTGVLPIAGEPEGAPVGADRLWVGISLAGDRGEEQVAARLAAAAAAGEPVVGIALGDRAQLAGEMFRWEVATAAAGAALGVQPFDQPDVELTKKLTREAMDGGRRGGRGEGFRTVAAAAPALAPALAQWLAGAAPGGYLAIQAFLAPQPALADALARLRLVLARRSGLPTTLGFGPRFLHSTGQLHKGGRRGGLFLQLVDRPRQDLPVPGAGFTFGQLLAAQALGDARALVQRGRPVLRVDLGPEPLLGLESLAAAAAGD